MDPITMVNFMLQMVMMKMMFNDFPHAVGLLEPYDMAAEPVRPEIEASFEVKKPDFVGMSDPRSINEGLRQSMREEQTAIAKYETRASHARLNGDEPTAELYEHVATEEDQHYQEFGIRLKERLQGQVGETRAIKY